jgi:hypothetical protein
MHKNLIIKNRVMEKDNQSNQSKNNKNASKGNKISHHKFQTGFSLSSKAK